MNHALVKRGMKVRILSLNKTDQIYQSNRIMREMVGQVCTIALVEPNIKLQHAKTNPIKVKFKENFRYVWDPEDLECLEKIIITNKAVSFDPKNLVISQLRKDEK